MRHYWLTSDAPDLPGSAFRKAFGRNRPATLEGGKGGSAPAAPDPFQTAAATTQTNEQTAQFNKALNLNNNSNLLGSQQSNVVAYDPKTGAPIYNSTSVANPLVEGQFNNLFGQIGQNNGINSTVQNGFNGLQGQYQGLNGSLGGLQSQYQNLSNATVQNLFPQIAGIGQQYGTINNALGNLSQSLSPAQAAAAQQQGQNAAYAAQTQYLDPQFSQQKESLDAQLANQGITPGSQAYNNAMLNFGNQKQQAYSNAQNQSILTGSQIGTQNLQNQISGINTQAGLYGQQAGNLGQMSGLVNQQAGIYGQLGQNLGQQAGLYGQQGSNLSQMGALYGNQANLGNMPYQQLQSIAGMIPGYTGTSQSSAAPADIGNYINNQYQAQLAGHNADVQSANATTGAIGAGLGMAAMAFF